MALCSAFSTLAFAATVERDTSVLSGSWSEASSWVGGQVPADGDTVRLTGGTSTDYSDGTASLYQISIIDSDLSVSGGSLTFTNKLYFWGGLLDISGSAYVSSNATSFGNYDSTQGSVGAKDAVINLHGSATLYNSAHIQDGFGIGTSSLDKNVTMNIYEDAKVENGRLLLGSKIADSTSKTTLNIYGNANVSTDYVNLYRNVSLNVGGNARIDAQNALRFGDMTGSSVASEVKIYGSAVIASNSGNSCIFDSTTVTVSDSAALRVNNLNLGKDWEKLRSAGSLVLRDSARFGASTVTLYNDSQLVIVGSNLEIISGRAAHITNLGSSSLPAGQSGSIKFVADQSGIGGLICENLYSLQSDSYVGYEIILDFSNIVDETGTYEIITGAAGSDREKAIIAAYANPDNNLVEVLKANEDDIYNLFVSDDGKTLMVSYTQVPEPAVCALAFGALALCFALRGRRRA